MTDPLLDRLTRAELAKTLTEAGYPISRETLRTFASKGGGPPYKIFGNRSMYVLGEALKWARGRVTEPRGRAAWGTGADG